MLGVNAFYGEETHTKAKSSKHQKRERVVIDLNPDALELMNELQRRTGASTRAELLRNMLKYAAATIDEIDAGNVPLWMDKEENIYRSMMHKILLLK